MASTFGSRGGKDDVAAMMMYRYRLGNYFIGGVGGGEILATKIAGTPTEVLRPQRILAIFLCTEKILEKLSCCGN